jgi:hypothetical protein
MDIFTEVRQLAEDLTELGAARLSALSLQQFSSLSLFGRKGCGELTLAGSPS